MTKNELRRAISLDLEVNELERFSDYLKKRFADDDAALERWNVISGEAWQNTEFRLSDESKHKLTELKRKFMCEFCNIIDGDILEKRKEFEKL
jgi:hypothetical protein